MHRLRMSSIRAQRSKTQVWPTSSYTGGIFIWELKCIRDQLTFPIDSLMNTKRADSTYPLINNLLTVLPLARIHKGYLACSGRYQSIGIAKTSCDTGV